MLESSDGQFHLHPAYAEQTSLDVLLEKVKPGFDAFVNEEYHDAVAAILGRWSAELLNAPTGTAVIENALTQDFLGSSIRPLASRVIRSVLGLEVRLVNFEQTNLVSRDAFLTQMRQELGGLSQIITADFQVTRLNLNSGVLHTHVLYELVGAGKDFYREQRTGFWDLEWITDTSGFRLRRWFATDEQRSRAARVWYSDITEQALRANRSYAEQILHGVDYWRTVLDGASGIDIYGHNGVSVGDIDNDGFDDLYVCQPAGLSNRLFRNRGDGTFEDVTEQSGTGILDNTACALFADFTNNGRQDLLVVRSGGPVLFLNDGNGVFHRKPDAFRFANTPQGTFTGAAAADYNRDGLLDVYFCLYVYYQGADQYKYPAPYYDAENGPPNFLMCNNGDGTFRDVTMDSGLSQNNTRYSFCCGWGDYNGDGWPDLYVVNDFGRKNLYRNNGDGTFIDIAPQAGVEDVGAGMSVCWLDYNDDGAEDLYVGNMWTAAGERISHDAVFKKKASGEILTLYRKHAMGNSLLENTLGKEFRDVTAKAGVDRGRWSWSSDAWDFDHDGFPDLYVTNGMVSGPSREDLNSFFWRQVVANSRDDGKPSTVYEQGWNAVNELLRSDYSWSGYERNVVFANNRDGTFSDVSGALGLDFVEDGRAFVLSDFDHDGRQEVFLKNRNAPQLRILKNVCEDLPGAIAIRLRGTKSNRDAIGVIVTVETETRKQTRTLQAGSGFLSQSSKELFFGLGQDRGPTRVSVRWPSGMSQQFSGLPSQHRIYIVEGNDTPELEPFRAAKTNSRPIASGQTPGEQLPERVETWLLAPTAAPEFLLQDASGKPHSLADHRGKPVLLTFCTTASKESKEQFADLSEISSYVQVLAVNFDDTARGVRRRDLKFAVLRGNDQVAGVYNLTFRYIFDRHRDLSLPTSFLLNAEGEIVKIYQGEFEASAVSRDVRQIPRTSAERLQRALPFPRVADTFEFARNHLSFGSVYFQRGYLQEAEGSFLLALREDPLSAEADYGLASVYLKQNKLDRAREKFEQAVKGKASYPDTLPNAWNNLGLIAARDGQAGKAVGYFERALQANPDYVTALENLGSAYRQLHEWGKAERVLQQAVALQPDRPELHYSLGMVFAQTDQPQRAYEYLQHALSLRPDYPEALNNLGVLYLRTRRIDEAIADFKRCIEVAPTFDQAYLNLAKVYALQGDAAKARSILTELLKQQPDNIPAQRALDELR